MAIFLFILAVVGIPTLILLKNQYGTKWGCGRGCATCGNRHLCHGTGAYRDHPQQKGTKK